jgi:polyhydroxyalkanoate synthesis regulator phasin
MDEAYKKADGDLDTRIKELEAIDHSHTFVESELNKIKDGDVAKWNVAEQNAKNYADGLADNYDQKGAALAAQSAAKSYTDGLIASEVERADGKYELAGAEERAKAYADGLASNYDTEGSAAQALTDAKAYTNQKVGKVSATVSAMDTAYKQADTALSGRLDTVEGKLANVSNVMDFRGAVTELPEVDGYQNGDVIVVTGGDNKGKEYVLSDGAWVEFGNVDAQQTAIAGLQDDVDKLEKSVADLAAEDTKICEAFAKADDDLQTAINGKVAQGDFDTLSGKVTTLEGKPAVGITSTQISN